MISLEKIKSSEEGFALFFAALLVLGAMLVIAGSIVFLTSLHYRMTTNEVRSTQSYYLAEAGIEDTMLRLSDSDMELYFPYTISTGIDGVGATTTVTEFKEGDEKVVRSRGKVNEGIRIVESRMVENTTKGSFYYGIQVGEGGLLMENDAAVEGSVFSNGNINGKNAPVVHGDVIVASTSAVEGEIIVEGNAQAYQLKNSEVKGEAHVADTTSDSIIGTSATSSDLYSDTITDSEVWGDAYYNTSITNTTVHGTTSTTSPPEKVEPEGFPVPDSEINQWKNVASSTKVIDTDDPECSEGEYLVPDGTELGPVKIECDTRIKGDHVTANGYIWVEGDFTMETSAVLELDESFGDKSSALVADYPTESNSKGKISIGNSAQIKGSGSTSSYMMVVSQNDSAENGDDNEVAIDIQNSSNFSIFYAPHGRISISNNIDLKEVTGYRVEIMNNSKLSYEEGLADLDFSSGPEGGWEVVSWKEVK